MRTRVLSWSVLALAIGCTQQDDRRFWTWEENATAGVPVLLTVTTNPPTLVTVVPSNPARTSTSLGNAPLFRVPGAMVADTLLFEDPAACLRAEQTIQFGQPHEEKVLHLDFPEGRVTVLKGPEDRAAYIACNGHVIGVMGTPIRMAAGKHRLEARRPIEDSEWFEVTVVEGRTAMVWLPSALTRADREPEVEKELKIPYPEQARRDGIAGTVRLKLVVDALGSVSDAKVLEGPGHGLDEAARAAVMKFEFRPAIRGGKAVSAAMVYNYTFILD